MGRPSTYSPEVVEAICERLSAGEPLAAICREEGMPGARTVYDWADGRPDVAAAIARARDEGEDAITIRARQTARGKGPDHGGDSTGDVQRDKLIIDLDLKLLAKWNPKKWGDKTTAELTIKRATEELGDDELAAIATSGGR